MLIEELLTLGRKIVKENIIKSKKIVLSQRFKSLSQASTETTYFFPVICSEQLTSDEVMMLMKMFERNYAIFTMTAFSLIPIVDANSAEYGIKDHLSKVHQNIGVPQHPGTIQLQLNSSADNVNYGILNEQNSSLNYKLGNKATISIQNNDIPVVEVKDKGKKQSSATSMVRSTVDYEWKKANEALPTTIIIPLKFKDTVIQIPIHIKAVMHKAPTQVLIKDIVGSISQSRGFLNFVKYVSGEKDSLVDFLFGISNIKENLLNRSKSPWLDAFKRRRLLAKLAWGTVANNYKPIGTLVITMNEVNILKNEYDIDVFQEAKRIMKEYYLLGFTILDQTNEIAYVLFDSYPDFQELPYRTLEREASNQDKTLREMIRAMGRM